MYEKVRDINNEICQIEKA